MTCGTEPLFGPCYQFEHFQLFCQPTKSPSGAQVANGDPARIVSQRWSRLGSSRDRVFRLRGSATSRVAIVNAYLDTTAGQ